VSSIERITVNPNQCGGQPCIRGMRIRVSDVLDLLAAGLTPEQVLEELPDLEGEDVEACRTLLRGMPVDEVEEVALARAIQEGETSGLASRSAVFRLLDDPERSPGDG
jgi:uncharacterized protein (DUF433 family)